jgi:hypothetical protein
MPSVDFAAAGDGDGGGGAGFEHPAMRRAQATHDIDRMTGLVSSRGAGGRGDG